MKNSPRIRKPAKKWSIPTQIYVLSILGAALVIVVVLFVILVSNGLTTFSEPAFLSHDQQAAIRTFIKTLNE